MGEGVSRDVTGPTAVAAVTDLTSPVAAHQVEVTYVDTGTGIDLALIGVEDLLVSGPTNVAVEAVSLVTNFDGSVTATYRLGSTDGFNDADNGTYTIALAADAVTDHAGNGVGGAPSLASFAVNIAPPWSAGGIVAAINAGGGSYVSGATTYAPDTASSPIASLIGPAKITSFTSQIAGTDDDSLYQTYRYGKSFGYDIAGLAAGDYLVELSFAESYWTAPGKRVFDILAEGQEIVSDLDIYSASGGKNVALDLSRVVTVTDGTLNLRFDASGADDRDNALIGSFVIRKVSGAADSAPPQASAQVADVTVAATTADVIVTYTDPGSGLALGTIGTDDLLVTRPGNISVESVSVQVLGNGTVAATYRLVSPGGFTAADNGQHLITLVPGSARDQAGNTVDHAVDLGSFAVSIEASQINEISGTSDADALNGTAAADHIVGLGGNDVLNGLGGDDILDGGAGNDKLNGNAGADLMRGGAGNDTYFVDNAGDVLVEEAGGGTDTVNSDISFQLGPRSRTWSCEPGPASTERATRRTTDWRATPAPTSCPAWAATTFCSARAAATF
nr:malectin domain-containing carbohydrate-binding protein [Sphingomonas aerophila]